MVYFSNIYPDKIEDADEEYYTICSKQMDATMKSFFIKMSIIFGSATVGVFWPTHQLIVHGEKTTTTQFKFPFVDANSNKEFLANLLLQCIFGGYGLCGYVAIEVFIRLCTVFVL